jgi:hypothetical protein
LNGGRDEWFASTLLGNHLTLLLEIASSGVQLLLLLVELGANFLLMREHGLRCGGDLSAVVGKGLGLGCDQLVLLALGFQCGLIGRVQPLIAIRLLVLAPTGDQRGKNNRKQEEEDESGQCLVSFG